MRDLIRVRGLSLVLLPLVAAVALAACGGSGSNAQTLLNQTFSGNHPVNSGDLSVQLQVAYHQRSGKWNRYVYTSKQPYRAMVRFQRYGGNPGGAPIRRRWSECVRSLVCHNPGSNFCNLKRSIHPRGWAGDRDDHC